METRKLGSTGPDLSVVGLGCNNFGMRIDAAGSAAVVTAALDAGITHFDTAQSYGGGGRSEEFLGAALASRRDEAVIATKVARRGPDDPYTPGALRRRIVEGAEASLRRLRTDRIDLYYEHFPDPEAPIDEVLGAFDELVSAGKVLHIATSNVSAAQIEARMTLSAERGWAAFTGAQIEWSLIKREVEAEIVPAALKAGLGIVPYFPLASGLLTGKYRAGEPFPEGTRLASSDYFAAIATPENFAYVDALSAFAAERGHSVLELAVAWLVAHYGVTSVITGATRPEQIAANVAGADWKLSADDLAALPQLTSA